MKTKIRKAGAGFLRLPALLLLIPLLAGCAGKNSSAPAVSSVSAEASAPEETTVSSAASTPENATVSPEASAPAETSVTETPSESSGSPSPNLPSDSEGASVPGTGSGLVLLLDEQPWSGDPEAGVSQDDLTVYITHGGQLLIALPFSENHLVTVRQPDGSENTIILTGQLVRMMHANCGNQDCVGMGEVTRENLAERILGGFIICLPHELIVEVREP